MSSPANLRQRCTLSGYYGYKAFIIRKATLGIEKFDCGDQKTNRHQKVVNISKMIYKA